MTHGLQDTNADAAQHGTPIPPEDAVTPRSSGKESTSISLGTTTGLPTRMCYLACDVLAVMIGIFTAKLAFAWMATSWWQPFTSLELKLFGLFAAGKISVSALQGSYKAISPRPVRQFRGTTIGTALIVLKLLVVIWFFNLGFAQVAPLLVAAASVAYITTCFLRAYCRMKFPQKSWWGTQVLVVGSNSLAHRAIQYYVREPQWGVRPIGFVTEDGTHNENELPVPCLGKLEDIDRIAESTGVKRAIVALHQVDLHELRSQIIRSDARIRHWTIIPNLEQVTALWAEWSETARMPSLSISNNLAKPGSLPLKRFFDVVLSLITMITLFPLFAFIACLVRLSGKGPIFYKHNRVGRGGQRIKALKFRTMYLDADACLARYLEEHPELREEWLATHKLKDDPRVTRIGKFLRKTSLDELPQLWNVLVGEMSLVGPRPITDSEANKYRNLYQHYQQVLPGITGLWQVSGRNNTTYKERIDLDVYYVENWSVWLDLYILACTIKVVLFREGAY